MNTKYICYRLTRSNSPYQSIITKAAAEDLFFTVFQPNLLNLMSFNSNTPDYLCFLTNCSLVAQTVKRSISGSYPRPFDFSVLTTKYIVHTYLCSQVIYS